LEKECKIRFTLPKGSNKSANRKFFKSLNKKYLKQKGFHSQFKAEKIIGKGMSAQVYQAKRVFDEMRCAIKAFNKANF
jgi:serine/threonine protein kinase